MGLMSRIRDAVTGRYTAKAPKQELSNTTIFSSPLAGAYENLFAQVRPLIDEMKLVVPYGIGRNGAKLPSNRTPELNVLLYPNDEMGYNEFIDLAFATWLTELELNIHVWRDKRGNVFGYSILPPGSKMYLGSGKYYFQIQNADGEMETLSKDDVMTLRFSRSPRDPMRGVSPATASIIWAQIDDLMAQYQRAFFQNGAVPATITFVTASSREAFNKKVKELERGLKGAHNRNKTLYAYRQMLDDNTTGDEIEVKQIQGNNSTLAIKDLYGIICDKMNKSVGVSNFILGDDSSAKYDNAELSDHQFTKRRVYPALISFWGQFQHELDRITGGLGYAISFDLEIPELTDRIKTKAEIKRIEAETAKIKAETEVIKSQLNQPQTATEKIDTKKTTDAVKIRTLDVYEPKWQPGEEKIKAIYDLLMIVAKDMQKEFPELALDETKAKIVENLRADALDGAIEGAKVLQGIAVSNEVEEEVNEIISEQKFDWTENFTETLTTRTDILVDRFAQGAREAAENVFAKAVVEGMTQKQIAEELSYALPRARAEIIARNETHAAINGGRYDLDRYIADEYGMKCTLVWNAHIDSKTCEVCKAMNGQETPLDTAFPDHIFARDGEQITFEHNEWNDNGLAPHAHVNCRCTFDEKWSV